MRAFTPPATAPVVRRLGRRRRRLALAALVLGALALVAPACGNDTAADEGSTPGYDGKERPIDTRPFVLPTVGGNGSTTLPVTMFEEDPIGRSTVTSTAPPTTTTTLPIPPRQGDPICQAFVELIRYARSGPADAARDPAGFARRLSADIRRWIETLRELDAETYGGGISKLEQTLARLSADPSPDELEQIMVDFLAGDERDAPLVVHRDRVCPSIAAAM